MSGRDALGWALEAALWVLLGGWLGSWGLFAFVVAPTAFQVLPSQQEAGDLVAPILGILHNFGAFAGVGTAVLALAQRRGWLVVLLPLLLTTACLVSEYGITAAIEEVSPHAFGIDPLPGAGERFAELHQASRFVFGAVGLGVLSLIVLHARLRVAKGPRPRGTTLETVSQART